MTVRFLTIVIFSFLLLNCAQKDDSAKISKDNTNVSPHVKSSNDKSRTIITLIKKQKLEGYTSETIGAAFDSYSFLDKKEWKESTSQRGTIFIDFIGWFPQSPLDTDLIKRRVSVRGVNVKFAVNNDGKYYVTMVSVLEAMTDGKINVIPLGDKKQILDAIYMKKDIKL